MTTRALAAFALASALLVTASGPGSAAPATSPATPDGPPAVVGDAPAAPDTVVRKARKKKARKKKGRRSPGPLLRWKITPRWWVHVPIEGVVAAGWFDGHTYRREAGGLLDLDVAATPTLRYRRDRFQLRLPVAYRGHETFGASLPERTLEGGVAVSGRPVRALTLAAAGAVAWVQRDDWPDDYQPALDAHGDPSDALDATDRYSHLDFGGGVSVAWRFSKALSLEGYGGVLDRRYAHDPAYDDLLAPTHLVPADVLRWRGGVAARGRVAVWRWLVDLRADWLSYGFTFARDAGTGLTGAGPGGAPANPLQRFVRVRVRHRSSVRLGSLPARLVVNAAYTHNRDEHDGYYTWNELGVGLALRVRPVRRLRVEVGWDGDFRWYTDRGYQPGPSHPALDDGAGARFDQRHRLRGEVAYALWKRRLTPFVDVSWTHYRTNFPDYVPFQNPVASPYAIDFDYDDLAVRAGVRFDW